MHKKISVAQEVRAFSRYIEWLEKGICIKNFHREHKIPVPREFSKILKNAERESEGYRSFLEWVRKGQKAKAFFELAGVPVPKQLKSL